MADSENVFIFGAGVSFDAGIPLMAGFVEKMWDFAIRGQLNGKAISEPDREIFTKAMNIKKELDIYHGRALFDDRNLEDILSILSFMNLRPGEANKDKLSDFIQAISKTIELTCEVKYDILNTNVIQNSGSKFYQRFWIHLFNWFSSTQRFPAILTFNYDLVLERSLFQVLNNKFFSPQSIPFKGVRINYFHEHNGAYSYGIAHKALYEYTNGIRNTIKDGIELTKQSPSSALEIEILKLHGSLNFPKNTPQSQPWVTQEIDDPFILPPIFNKMTSGKSIEKIWEQALNRLANAKNIFIVGYSLPKTDIYMQFFLKAALGPNVDLNRIYVFDPILFKEDGRSKEMKDRYAYCFSPQLQSRIIFRPPIPDWICGSINYPSEHDFMEKSGGTFEHFVHLLSEKGNILF